MGVLSENEFKDAATPSQEKLRKLLTLALYGNDSFHSVFTAMADQAGTSPRGQEEREKRQEHYAMLRRMMMASQEQVAEFQRKLDRLERAVYEARIETEERLRDALRREKEILEQAFTITVPDGRTVRVFRDGGDVYDENDNLVDSKLIKAEDIPEHFPQRRERRENRQEIEALEARRSKLIDLEGDVQDAREDAADGRIAADDLAAFEARIGRNTPADLADREGLSESHTFAPDGAAPAGDDPARRHEVTRPGPDASMNGPA